MRIVVDASVAAKWFNVEELSDKAVEVKNDHVRGDLELVAPVHIVYEVGNSLWKNPQLTEEDAGDAIASLLRLGMQLIQPSKERVATAMRIARSRRATFYDATYVQTAEELKTALLTADASQAAAGRDIVRVMSLHEYGP